MNRLTFIKEVLPLDLARLVLNYLTLCKKNHPNHPNYSNIKETPCSFCHEVFCSRGCDEFHKKSRYETFSSDYQTRSRDACYVCLEPNVCPETRVQCSCDQVFHESCTEHFWSERVFFVKCTICDVSVCHRCTAPTDEWHQMSWVEWSRCSGIDWFHESCTVCHKRLLACSALCMKHLLSRGKEPHREYFCTSCSFSAAN